MDRCTGIHQRIDAQGKVHCIKGPSSRLAGFARLLLVTLLATLLVRLLVRVATRVLECWAPRLAMAMAIAIAIAIAVRTVRTVRTVLHRRVRYELVV